MSREWRKDASCRGHDPEMWFSYYSGRPGPVTQRARAICLRCPVRSECLDEALSRAEEFGMWGGMLPHERARELVAS